MTAGKSSVCGQAHRREIRRVELDTCRAFGKRFSGQAAVSSAALVPTRNPSRRVEATKNGGAD